MTAKIGHSWPNMSSHTHGKTGLLRALAASVIWGERPLFLPHVTTWVERKELHVGKNVCACLPCYNFLIILIYFLFF